MKLVLLLALTAVLAEAAPSLRKSASKSGDVEGKSNDAYDSSMQMKFRHMAAEMVNKMDQKRAAQLAKAQAAMAPGTVGGAIGGMPSVPAPFFSGGFGMGGGPGMMGMGGFSNPYGGMYNMGLNGGFPSGMGGMGGFGSGMGSAMMPLGPMAFGFGHPAGPDIHGQMGPGLMGGQLGFYGPWQHPFMPAGVGGMGYPYSGFGMSNPYGQGHGDEPPKTPMEAATR